jgi:very-short-patch-repair endonuclease
LSYRIDYYIKDLNIAIEYDENEHKNYTYEQQELRQAEIEKELGCRFIRVSDKNSDEYNIGLIIKELFQIAC